MFLWSRISAVARGVEVAEDILGLSLKRYVTVILHS